MTMARLERFFDLTIATVAPGEAPPTEAHWVRIAEPTARLAADLGRDGWFHKPCYVTYVAPVAPSPEAYIAHAFRRGKRGRPRRLLREVPRRFREELDPEGRHFPEFEELYRRTIVAKPRGKDRLAEHREGVGPGVLGLYLYDGPRLAAGILAFEEDDVLSVGYGAFDPAHRAEELELYLLMRAMQEARRRGRRILALGMDTNRYGHHLALGLAPYKLGLGFIPLPASGTELVKIQRHELFEEGLFFWSFDRAGGLAGHLFGPADPRPFRRGGSPPVYHHTDG